MNLHELRIGNLVKIHGHKGLSKVNTVGIATQSNYVRVNYIDEENNDRISNGYADEIVRPIPLTEEILLKVGFVQVENYQKGVLGLNGVRMILFAVNWTWNDFSRSKEINSLHQLQNLYFALTGSELDTSKLL